MENVFNYSNVSEKILEAIELPSGVLYPDLSLISNSLKDRLNLQDLTIEVEKTCWLVNEEIEQLANSSMSQLSFSTLPLEASFHWLMDLNEVSKITTWAMTKDASTKAFSSEILQEGYYHYLMLEAMDVCDKNKILEGFSLKILSDTKEFESPSLCVDIKIIYQERSAFAKLVFPKEIVLAWKNNFFKKPDLLTSKLADKADFFLSINVGNVHLNYTTFDSISVGDFVILDHSYYDPKTHQGSVLLTFNQHPLYQVKVKHGKLKILDYAELQEANMDNAEKPTPVKDVPLSIQIEMGKIKMSLEKLMSLQPGEVIETTINPQENVSLILNNKIVAKGELIKVGDVIGVRILEI